MKEEKNKKFVYIILTKTNTKIGKIIRFMTHYEYNHVSISLNKNLKEIYSFARYYENAPFVGGFVVESILRYKNSNSRIKIFKLPVSRKTYNELKNYIEFLKVYKKKYLYNTFSAIFYIFKIDLGIKDSYTCIGFIKHLFIKFNIPSFTKKDFSTIKTIDNKLSEYKHFEGTYEELNLENDWGIDLYIKRRNIAMVYIATVAHFIKLLFRSII